MMAPLFGVYELRLGDAHLPSAEIEAAFIKVGVNRTALLVAQGQQLIAGAAAALMAIAHTFAQQRSSQPRLRRPEGSKQ